VDTAPGASPSAFATPSSTTPSTAVDTPLEIVSATAFDPAGDNEENDGSAGLAIDGDPATAWRTVTYASRELGGLKPGVGLLLHLGGQQQVSGIQLELVGRGSDLQFWAQRAVSQSPSATDPLAGYSRLASVRGAGDQLTWRFATPVQTRALLVWLTALPADGSGYRGGIAEVQLLS